jgi:segregation and condensation protein B
MTDIHETPEADKLAACEALLFMADRPLALGELADLLDVSTPAVRQLLEALDGRYLGIHLREVAGGYELVTRPELAGYVARLHEPAKVRLSQAALEALAIVAYRQPVTRPEIEELRGVNSDGVVGTLLDRGLLCERGHKQVPGRPVLYGTTDLFLRLFGLSDLQALPDISTFIEHNTAPLEGFTEATD